MRLVRVVTEGATNESWAQGFADEFLVIQQQLKAARSAARDSATALVLVEKDALIEAAREQAATVFDGVTAVTEHTVRDGRAYVAGKVAARGYAASARAPAVCV